ncbi:hypothetical protein INT44_000196 [Umbelopsis vinacea]|uniref:PSP proline-rich domain-containing protein n=1 Tax=Umbelopsis vinacea TaxID=44442 RepID=A0A8H7UA65_9FUNG|nr:hypothetical protein INT44_000196 [Umbelopsis vinacea]
MISPSVQPSHGSDTNISQSTISTNNNLSTSSEENQIQNFKSTAGSFPELYRKSLSSASPYNYEKSDALNPNFADHWASTSQPEDDDTDADGNIPIRERHITDTDTSSSSGPGSGDILSDEDRERLGSIQRGENTAIVGWLKDIGNHKKRQHQHNRRGPDKNKQQHACPHHKHVQTNGYPKRSGFSNLPSKTKNRPDDDVNFSGFEDSNNSQYDGMDSATGPCFGSSETSDSTSSNSFESNQLRKNTPHHNLRKRPREEDSPACTDIIEDLTIRNKKLKKRLKRLEDLYLGHRPPATSELFEVRYISMPQNKKRELESYIREFATHIRLDNKSPQSKSGTSGSSSEGLNEQPSQTSFDSMLKHNNALASQGLAKENNDSQIQPTPWTPSQALICEVANVIEATLTKPNLQQRDVIRGNSIDGWLPLQSLYKASNDLNEMNIPLSYLRHCLRRGSRHLELSKDQTRVRLKHVVMTGDSSNKDTGSDSTGSSFSGNNVFGSTFWALRTDVQPTHNINHDASLKTAGQMPSANHDDNSSFRPYTPCFSNRNVVSSVSSKEESDPSRRRTDSSNWSSDDQLIADMTVSDDLDDESMELSRPQPSQNSYSPNNDRLATPQFSADVTKVAPIIYVEGGTFCLDLSRFEKPHDKGPEEDDIPEYVRNGDAVLGMSWDENIKWQDLFCWNCESTRHTLRDCPQKFDDTVLCRNALEFARRYPDHQCNFRRYFDETRLRQQVEDMIVGKPSDALKEALGVSKDDLIMPYYDNMIKHGYPPGWKGIIRKDAHKQGHNIHKEPSNAQGKLKVWDNGRLVQISAYDNDSVRSVPNADIAKAGGEDGPVKFRDGTSKLVVDGKIGSHYHAAVGAEQRAKHSNEPRIKLVDYPGLRWRDEEFQPTNESQTSHTDSGIGSSHHGSEVSFKASKDHQRLPKATKIVNDNRESEDQSQAIDTN